MRGEKRRHYRIIEERKRTEGEERNVLRTVQQGRTETYQSTVHQGRTETYSEHSSTTTSSLSTTTIHIHAFSSTLLHLCSVTTTTFTSTIGQLYEQLLYHFSLPTLSSMRYKPILLILLYNTSTNIRSSSYQPPLVPTVHRSTFLPVRPPAG